MKNLKDLLGSYLDDSISATEQTQLNQTFEDAAEFQNFQATFRQRIAQKRQQPTRKMVAVGAIIVLALLGSAFLAKTRYDKAHEKPPMRKDIAMVEPPSQLADDNFDRAYRQTLSNVRQGTETTETNWKTAYKEGHFAEAAQLIERAGAKMSPETAYTLAICFIQQKQYDKAIAPLKNMSDNDPEQLKTLTPEARWLLANVYLKTNKTAEALRLLEEFVKNNAPHSEEAAVLLKKLK
jgi:tetratricopeptide (TPR) repeat protein